MTNRGFVGYPAIATSGILAVQRYNPGTMVTYATTSSTIADLDATNLAITFTAPASGNVLVILNGWTQVASGTTYTWAIRSGSTVVDEEGIAFAMSGPLRLSARFYVTGLTPGTSYTYKWAHRDSFSTGSSHVKVGGVVTAGDAGPAVMEVWSA